jgi:hypothetical protein
VAAIVLDQKQPKQEQAGWNCETGRQGMTRVDGDQHKPKQEEKWD